MMAAAAASLSACSTLGMGDMGRSPHGMGHAMPDGGMMSAPMPGMMMPTQAQAYIRLAGESDLYEITSSQIALQRTQNPELRTFATRLIDHHTMTTNATLSAAKAGRVPPPPAVLGPQKRAMIDQLNSQDRHELRPALHPAAGHGP
jgi:predicted outer membrane protein